MFLIYYLYPLPICTDFTLQIASLCAQLLPVTIVFPPSELEDPYMDDPSMMDANIVEPGLIAGYENREMPFWKFSNCFLKVQPFSVR